MKIIVSIEGPHTTSEQIVVAEINRNGPLTAATLGLTLAEAKEVLAEIQQQLVQAQMTAHVDLQRTCPECGIRRWLKDYRRVHFKSLFGSVRVTVPRLFGCGCDGAGSRARTLQLGGVTNWVAPELEYVQSHLAATIPYARASQLLSMLLPVEAGNATSTVRRRTLSVGERLETELRQAKDNDYTSSNNTRGSALSAMGLDSGYIRDCRPSSERSFEVILGRIIGANGGSRSLGFVRTIENNAQVRHRLKHRLAQQGRTTNRIAVFTDGDAGLRCLQLDVLPKAFHILDWYHLTRHLTVLKRVLYGEEAIEKLPSRCHDPLCKALKSLKWRLWHGQGRRALKRLQEMVFILGLPTISTKPVARRLRRLARKLLAYLKNNADSLINYGKRYRSGARISTSFIESAVNQLLDKRMSKSQQMRWSHYGAHLLLQVRSEVVDGRLSSNFNRWYPGFGDSKMLCAA